MLPETRGAVLRFSKKRRGSYPRFAALLTEADEINTKLDSLREELVKYQKSLICPNCGKQVVSDYEFCPICGAKLEKTPPPKPMRIQANKRQSSFV